MIRSAPAGGSRSEPTRSAPQTPGLNPYAVAAKAQFEIPAAVYLFEKIYDFGLVLAAQDDEFSQQFKGIFLIEQIHEFDELCAPSLQNASADRLGDR
ncbi:hypothetical protein [Methylocystis echinoides]|jgi:hypothetical protein|uniref:hypothetical protein n=1 Tax=Methylocystis echinoides TaxID=29468 RepID=UPI00342D1E4A